MIKEQLKKKMEIYNYFVKRWGELPEIPCSNDKVFFTYRDPEKTAWEEIGLLEHIEEFKGMKEQDYVLNHCYRAKDKYNRSIIIVATPLAVMIIYAPYEHFSHLITEKTKGYILDMFYSLRVQGYSCFGSDSADITLHSFFPELFPITTVSKLSHVIGTKGEVGTSGFARSLIRLRDIFLVQAGLQQATTDTLHFRHTWSSSLPLRRFTKVC